MINQSYIALICSVSPGYPYGLGWHYWAPVYGAIAVALQYNIINHIITEFCLLLFNLLSFFVPCKIWLAKWSGMCHHTDRPPTPPVGCECRDWLSQASLQPLQNHAVHHVGCTLHCNAAPGCTAVLQTLTQQHQEGHSVGFPLISWRKPSNLTVWGHPSLGKHSIREGDNETWDL